MGTDDSVHPLEFLSHWSNGDLLYVDAGTGILRSAKRHSAAQILEYWGEKIFKSSSPEDYSAVNPFAQARLLYVALTIRNFLAGADRRMKSLCDFATGEGYFLRHARNCFPDLELSATEGSPTLAAKLGAEGFPVLNCGLGEGALSEATPVDVGVLTWTLCNCIDPLAVPLEIRDAISESGYLCVADSSRIMVPYRKSLRDYVSQVHPLDIHPFCFSHRALAGLLRVAGFVPVYTNRYFDSDVLCIIAQRVELPAADEPIEVDDPAAVVRFMAQWHEQSLGFEQLRPAP